MEVAELQKEYDSVSKEIKSLNKKKKAIVKKVQDNGFAVFSGKIKEDTKVFGLFYDLSFYSHFDGHLSDPIYFDESGANEVEEDSFNKLKSLIERYQKQGNDDDKVLFREAIAEVELNAPEDFWQARNFFKHFSIINDKRIDWKYKGDEDQSELASGSSVEIYLSTKSKIKSVKTVDSRWD